MMFTFRQDDDTISKTISNPLSKKIEEIWNSIDIFFKLVSRVGPGIGFLELQVKWVWHALLGPT